MEPEKTELHYILRVNRGLIRLERGNVASAADDLREAIRLDGNRFEAYRALAKVYERQTRIDDALEQFARAIQLRPNWPPLYRARADLLLALKQLSPQQRDAALSDLDAAIRYESPGSPTVAQDRTKQAALLHQTHRDEDALKACDAALELSPRNAAAHLLRARILRDMKRYDDLIRSCDVALGSGKPSTELYELRGVAKDAREDHPGAVSDYTMALGLQAGNPRLHRRRGWSYLAQDASRPAATDFGEAIRLDPANADAYSGRGFAQACLGHHSEAVSDADEAMRRGDSSWRVAYNSARIYARAATAAGSEARKTGPDAVHLVSRYQDSALRAHPGGTRGRHPGWPIGPPQQAGRFRPSIPTDPEAPEVDRGTQACATIARGSTSIFLSHRSTSLISTDETQPMFINHLPAAAAVTPAGE